MDGTVNYLGYTASRKRTKIVLGKIKQPHSILMPPVVPLRMQVQTYLKSAPIKFAYLVLYQAYSRVCPIGFNDLQFCHFYKRNKT
ncbi:MAG: hypothetical protein A4E63_01085 [Syntrophorhabdus sp. PtaU1.Bin050]|nr:MAG: hypothetical protein A4E63_01085 [Syntrophorhabdus sp. PtaU1.Bin050]